MSKKRELDIAVLSDIHLGTYGCHAEEVVNYLKSIQPEVLVLNGDIIDIWQFNKRYWPKSHMAVLKEVMKIIARGTTVYYLTGNHDEMLRKFSDFSLGNFHLRDKVVLEMDGKQAWIFHGDIFDASMQHAKWLAKLGGAGYDLLILINSFVNWCLVRLGREKMSFSKKVKASVKGAVSFISDFERVAADLAIENNYDYVVCGHIHQAEIRKIQTDTGSVTYLNSGDWVESLTSLEYAHGEWSLYQYQPSEVEEKEEEPRRRRVKELSAKRSHDLMPA
ncbi:MAG: UDP-2,3-diacylglucosamine diphosphatase [Bacteroidia bacterium]|nr:UDP-2,3-diacylglucosamine diphosphatase [Bacteroidia bacterium]